MYYQITALYAGLLTLFYVFLSGLVVSQRMKNKVGVGPGKTKDMLVATRVHGNYSEYVPLALFMMLLVENAYAVAWFPHLLGIWLLASRLVYSYALWTTKGNTSKGRAFGMLSTFLILAISALAVIGASF